VDFHNDPHHYPAVLDVSEQFLDHEKELGCQSLLECRRSHNCFWSLSRGIRGLLQPEKALFAGGWRLANCVGLDCEQEQLRGPTGPDQEVRKGFRLLAIRLAYRQQSAQASGPAKWGDCADGGFGVQETPVWLLIHFGNVKTAHVSLLETGQGFGCEFLAVSRTLVSICGHMRCKGIH
jgi:hypothetical protein